jgi:hypothetical protein
MLDSWLCHRRNTKQHYPYPHPPFDMDPGYGGTYKDAQLEYALTIIGHVGNPHLLHGESQQCRNNIRSTFSHW